MRAELVMLGKRIDMASQKRRRALVITIYAILTVLIALLWRYTHLRETGAYVYFAVILACRYFLGGYYRGGLVKPFRYIAPRTQDAPPPLLALKLRMYHPYLQADDAQFKNDERELHQRDHAHYLAYQVMGIALAIMVFGVALHILPHHTGTIFSLPVDLYELNYAFGLILLALYLTLPQSILLWTEPDMDADMEFVR